MNSKFRGLAAFQPPSDMVGNGSGGSGKKKIWVGLGIGCGVLLLLIGIAFAAGAFKAVSCCNTLKDAAEQSQGAQQFGERFSRAISDGELQKAYSMTSSEFQSKLDSEAFESAVNAHRDKLSSGSPRLFNLQVDQKDPNQPSFDDLTSGIWQMSYQFAGPSDDRMLLLNFTVRRIGEGEEAKFVAENVKFDERARNLANEPPAREVLEVHDLIQRGQYERAYGRLGMQFKQESDRDTFNQFIDDTGEVLTSSELQIREVAYNDSNSQATVMAHARSSSGKNAIIQYELVPLQKEMPGFAWRIVTISPMIAEVAEDGPDEPVPPMPDEDAEAQTHGATDDAPVKAPEVEVTE